MGKKEKYDRDYSSLDNEEPLPKGWWKDAPEISAEAEEDLFCDISRWYHGFFGSNRRSAQRLIHVDDIYRLAAENVRLRYEQQSLEKKIRKLKKKGKK